MPKHTFKRVFWKGKEVGQLRDDLRVFRTTRNQTQVYRKLNSLGFSIAMIEYLENLTDFRLIQLRLKLRRANNTESNYRIGLKEFKNNADKINNPQSMFKDDKQYHIDLEYLDKITI